MPELDQHATKIQCPECALELVVPRLTHKQKATCPRCGYLISMYRDDGYVKATAYALSALIMLVLTMPFEFVSFNTRGQEQSIDLLNSVTTLLDNDYVLLGLFQFVSIIVIPSLLLFGILYLLIPVMMGTTLPKYREVFNIVFKLVPWSMAEIFLLGVLVALIKMTDLAQIHVGLSFYAYVLFTILLITSLFYLDKHQLMQTLGLGETTQSPLTQLDLAQLRNKSTQRTWALLITAVMFYIPSNILPIMTTRVLGSEETNTILGGVVTLWTSGSYPVASIIFIASVVVPVLKLIMLSWLNYSVQTKSDILNQQRVMCYRITEFIGRWSMIDVFVVAILVSLIQLGNTMSIFPGPAAIAFCGVVITTMFAAITFDTRLIWESEEKP